jgi:hypothetical protein
MTVYLKGSPLSTKRGPFALDIGPQTKESINTALIHRSEELNAASPSGLSHIVRTLKCAKHISQLRATTRGSHVLLCWLWLSDGSRYRLAWLLGSSEEKLFRSWERIPWDEVVFRQPAEKRPPRRAS